MQILYVNHIVAAVLLSFFSLLTHVNFLTSLVIRYNRMRRKKIVFARTWSQPGSNWLVRDKSDFFFLQLLHSKVKCTSRRILFSQQLIKNILPDWEFFHHYSPQCDVKFPAVLCISLNTPGWLSSIHPLYSACQQLKNRAWIEYESCDADDSIKNIQNWCNSVHICTHAVALSLFVLCIERTLATLFYRSYASVGSHVARVIVPFQV